MLLVLVSVMTGESLFKISARAFKVDHNINSSWEYDSVIEWSELPNAKYDHVMRGSRFILNSTRKDFMIVNIRLRKPAGTKWTVVVGDSFCEALQVDLEETFFRLEGQLESMIEIGLVH